MDVRRVIVDHMIFIDYCPAGYTSAEQYIQVTGMDKFGTWGTDTEMVKYHYCANGSECADLTFERSSYFPSPIVSKLLTAISRKIERCKMVFPCIKASLE